MILDGIRSLAEGSAALEKLQQIEVKLNAYASEFDKVCMCDRHI